MKSVPYRWALGWALPSLERAVSPQSGAAGRLQGPEGGRGGRPTWGQQTTKARPGDLALRHYYFSVIFEIFLICRQHFKFKRLHLKKKKKKKKPQF